MEYAVVKRMVGTDDLLDEVLYDNYLDAVDALGATLVDNNVFYYWNLEERYA